MHELIAIYIHDKKLMQICELLHACAKCIYYSIMITSVLSGSAEEEFDCRFLRVEGLRAERTPRGPLVRQVRNLNRCPVPIVEW